MDPNTALAELVLRTNAILNDEDPGYNPDNIGQDAVALAEGFHALHTWLMSGGFLPAAWAR